MTALERGADLLHEVHDFLARFIAFPSDAALHAVTLWVAVTHLAQHFHSTPRRTRPSDAYALRAGHDASARDRLAQVGGEPRAWPRPASGGHPARGVRRTLELSIRSDVDGCPKRHPSVRRPCAIINTSASMTHKRLAVGGGNLMAETTQQLDYDTAVAALTYIAQRMENPTFHAVFKVLYGAEKRHFQDYAQPIIGDEYIAMDDGPVPSVLYDLMKRLRNPKVSVSLDPELVKIAGRHLAVEARYRVVVREEPDVDALSDSAIECLDAALAEVGRMAYGERKRWSHDAAWKAAPINGVMPWEAIVRTLPNAEVLVQHMRDPYPD